MNQFHQLVSLAKSILRHVSTLSPPNNRFYLELLSSLVFLFVITWLVGYITPYNDRYEPVSDSSSSEDAAAYYRGKVINVLGDDEVSVELLDGPTSSSITTVRFDQQSSQQTLSQGDTILLRKSFGSQSFTFIDKYRIPGLVITSAIFAIFVVIIGRKRGLASLAGLFTSIIVVGWLIIPLIISGYDPLWVCILGALIIAVVSIIIAHGARPRTYIALFCVIFVMLLVAVAATLAVKLLDLTGVTDEASALLAVTNSDIQLSGVLTGGVIIASLGVLDDIITTQIATVDELLKANPGLTLKELINRASSVGTEHIASLVNTLVLVYVGAALPTILVLLINSGNGGLPILNSEYIATEITRTLIVSIGLVLSVPFSTYVAANLLMRNTGQTRTNIS